MKKKFIVALTMGCLYASFAAKIEAFPPPPPGQFVKEIEVDVNNDGKPDKVRIDTVKGKSTFTLTVNHIKATGFLGQSEEDGNFEPDGFYIVDIDSSDNFKGIAVHSSGPSDDDVYLIYAFDGQALHKMARLSRWPTFFGNGIVLVDDWMGFWARKKKYLLNRSTRSLQFIPQEFYYVGVQATVEQSFPLYRQRQNTSIVANLMPHSKIDILLCDCSDTKNWYLIKSTTGLIGWARLESFREKVRSLPWAD